MGVALVRLKLGAPWLENGTLVRCFVFCAHVPSPHAHYLCWRTGTMDRWECAAFAEWLKERGLSHPRFKLRPGGFQAKPANSNLTPQPLSLA
jgi:DNA-binding transcriptional LysR family regulator